MEKIMLVDDAEISNFILRKRIEKLLPTHEIIDFTSPEKAMAEIETIHPAILFLDINMPVIDGWQFLDLLKAKGIFLPVYILSSSTSEIDRLRSAEYDMVKGFLNKPVNEVYLQNIFQELRIAA